jgi:hypothetical protein
MADWAGFVYDGLQEKSGTPHQKWKKKNGMVQWK